MENKIYGYVRVSSTDQNEDRQMIALNKVNVPAKNIYMDISVSAPFMSSMSCAYSVPVALTRRAI